MSDNEFNLKGHLEAQKEFFLETFGPGDRTLALCDHIRKELNEVEVADMLSEPTLPEWIDVIILGFEGALRTGATPQEVIQALVQKQAENTTREWPDWRTADPNKAIEHVRESDDD